MISVLFFPWLLINVNAINNQRYASMNKDNYTRTPWNDPFISQRADPFITRNMTGLSSAARKAWRDCGPRRRPWSGMPTRKAG